MIYSLLLLAVATADLPDCMQVYANYDRTACLQSNLNALDKTVSREFVMTVGKLKSSFRKNEQAMGGKGMYLFDFIQSQRAFLIYRKNECLAEGSGLYGGTGESEHVVQCQIRITKQRLKDIYEVYRYI